MPANNNGMKSYTSSLDTNSSDRCK